MKILAWDTELTPITAYTWSLWPNAIPITQIVKSPEVLCFGSRWLDQKKVTFKSVHEHGKREMLETIHAQIDEADALLSWNGQGFDTKHMQREFLENGMKPPSPVKEIDLMRTVKQNFRFPSNKLDYVSQALGVGEKTKHTGFQLWIDCMAGDPKAWKLMEKYQKQDVNLLVDLYSHLQPWIKNHPSVALHDDILDGCPNCGGTDLQSRGTITTGTTKYKRYSCNKCGKWVRGSQRITSSTMRGV